MEKIDIKKKYNLPNEIKYCNRCVISNQRPRIDFDDEGICSGCRYFEFKSKINWEEREKELINILDQHRSQDGSYDCVVPSSGGKDSAYVAHELKTKYKMNPLTVTWSPLKYTEIGWENLQNFNKSGFDVMLGMANGKTVRRLCKDALIEIGDPFQPFIYGQVLFPIKIATKFNIKLVFSGENAEAEYGGGIESWNKKGLDVDEYEKIWFSKYSLNFWLNKGYSRNDLNLFMGPEAQEVKEKNIKRYFYGYFRNWSNHSNFYYASKNTGFKPNTVRTEGTYTKYSSIDDKLDTFHHWFALIKFGHGRCTSNAAREVREGFITREEAIALVKKYDNEFPIKYFNDFLEFAGISEEQFWQNADKWRNENIWVRKNEPNPKKGEEWQKKNIVK
tara:strand:- start:427 stop:1596 length:1170 start_codon:yes stop_codon:yes gene_type:complete